MKTLKSKTEVKGTGLMSAVAVTLEISPSDKKGIRFHIANNTIEANLSNVVSTEHCVVIADINEISKGNIQTPKIALIEHFMASMAILGLDALDVRFINPNFETAAKMQNAFEMPILDGSAKEWVKILTETGFEGDEEKVNPLNDTITFQKGKSAIIIMPSDETKITYCVNYDHPDLKNRFFTLTKENINEIIEARTFGYLKDLEKLQEAGFSKGVTYENTVGLTDISYTTDLRSENEPIKHKILDIIGDLRLTNYNPLKLNANIIIKEAGHALHIEAAKLLLKKIEEKK